MHNLPDTNSRSSHTYTHTQGLGLVNDVVKEIYGDLGKLGALDPGAPKKVLQEHGALFELEVCVSSSVDGLVDVLGAEAAVLVAASPPRFHFAPDLLGKMLKHAGVHEEHMLVCTRPEVSFSFRHV